LAETLINNKSKEIADLEGKYESKIIFNFNNQLSLHEPLFELESQKKIIIEDTESKNIKTKKKIIRKKTRVKKKIENKKIKIVKNKKDEKDSNKIIKTKKKSKKKEFEKKELKNENDNNEEKTGWWS
jgi:preprotein translocase subunit SecD